uniref:Uncharacterized protein n=1 Tax=Siphoviridae sp. ctYBm1 TaxID=2826374 RepID=A0A8S5LSJ7_9CAUD|nr:MAG TPA: hypothetical protein [Siphoviridae sp. ctYBm1]
MRHFHTSKNLKIKGICNMHIPLQLLFTEQRSQHFRLC